MSLLHKLKNSTFSAFLQDQHLPGLFRRREFRLTEAFLRRELLTQVADEEIPELDLELHDGYAEVRGVIKKRFMPQLAFSLRLRVVGVEFNAMAKRLHLAVDDVKPLDVDWITRRLVERVSYLNYAAGRISIDLDRMPRLEIPLAYRIKGVRVADFFTIKEIHLRLGEVVGRLGVTL